MIDLRQLCIDELTFDLVNNTLVYSEGNRLREGLKIVTIFHTERSWYIRTKFITRYYGGYAFTYSLGLSLEDYLNKYEWTLIKSFFRHSKYNKGVEASHCDSNELFDPIRETKFGRGSDTELPLFKEVEGYTLSDELFVLLTGKIYEECWSDEEKRLQQRKHRRRNSGSQRRLRAKI